MYHAQKRDTLSPDDLLFCMVFESMAHDLSGTLSEQETRTSDISDRTSLVKNRWP